MLRRKKLKRTLALLLTAAMALTGPAESMVSVQAAQVQESETEPGTEIVSEQDSETVQESETLPEQKETEKTSVETTTETPATEEASTETQLSTETMTETSSSVETTTEETSASEIVSETEEQTAVETETAEEETTEMSEITETEEATEEIKLTADEMENAVPLSVNKKENFTIKRDEECGWYSFTLPKDGVYALRMEGNDFDSWYYNCNVSGQSEWLDMFSVDTEIYQRIFRGKEGEIVYFQPRVYASAWYDYDDIIETQASFEIHTAEQGTASADGDKYVLSHNNTKINLEVESRNTSIHVSAAADKNDDNEYYLSVLCNDVAAYDSLYYGSYDFNGLDINNEYHLVYVLLKRDKDSGEYNLFAWFDDTGLPFDVSTKQTDKVGGELRLVNVDFGSITVEYELFSVDTAGRDGYIRYRKSGETDWVYEEAYDYEVGNSVINADSETTYEIELVSWDKKTVYDRLTVTTEKYTGQIIAEVNEDSITTTAAKIDIKGLKKETEKIENLDSLRVTVKYTDSEGIEQSRESYYSSDAVVNSESVIFDLNSLSAATEYQNVKIWVRVDARKTNGKYYRQLIYTGQVSFKTKESVIKEENISIESAANGLQTAVVTLEVKGIPKNKSIHVWGEYRLKGHDGNYWRGMDSRYLTNVENTSTFDLYGLEETDYELRFIIDGVRIIKEYSHAPKFTGSVKAKVEVTDAFVNGIELECSLEGADSKDKYTCHLEVCSNQKEGYWNSVYYPYSIDLDVSKPVKWKVYSYSVYPGQTQRWRYTINRNDSTYYIGYFEAKTNTMEVELSSVKNSSYSNISGNCKINNWTDVIKNDDEEANIEASFQIRKKGQGAWQQAGYDYADLYFNNDGSSSFSIWLEDNVLEPNVEYEIRLVSRYDESIVYGTTSFVAESIWHIYDKKIVYNPKTNSRQSISIYDNYEKPSVTVENESIVSVREIRQAKIYLDVHNIGTTKLYVTADGTTKEITVTVTAPLKQDLYYLEGADTSLADIASGLPENFKWVDSSESLKADDENKVQYFDVEYTEEDENGKEVTKYASVPVAVGKLDSIEIRGRENIGAGKEGVYSVYYNSAGFDVNYYAKGKAYEITQKWTGNENLKITGTDSERNVTVTGGNTADTYDLTLTATVKNLLSGKTCEVKEIKKVRVIGAGLIDNLIIQPDKEQPADAAPYVVSGSIVSGTIIEVNYVDYEQDKSKDKVQLKAETNAGQAESKPADVTWESKSADIIAVDETGLVTIKGRGEGYIEVTAKDEGKYSERVVFKVYDDSPLFGSTSYTVRHGDSHGARLVFQAQDNNPVTNIRIDGDSSLEVIQHSGDSDWYLRTKADSTYSVEKVEQITLKVTTSKKEFEQKDIKVTVMPKPKADKTSATFKQTVKPNLFYVDAEAVFEVSGNYAIEDIRTVSDDKDATNFHVKSYDTASRQLILTANGLSKDTVQDYTKKNSTYAVANVEVKFTGYDDYVAFKNIKVSVQNKAISLKTEAAVVTEKSPNALIDVLSGKNVYDISGSYVAADSVTVKPAAKKEKLSAQVKDRQLQITYSDTGTANYTLMLGNDNWTKDIKLSGKVSKVDISKLSLKASKTKAIINTKYDETAQIALNVKGNSSMPVTLKCDSPNEAFTIVPASDNKSVTISVDKNKTIKNGNYKIKVYGEIEGENTKKTNITITVTDKEPTVKLSGKGSINMANRELSGITYTASIKNTDAEISKVEITDKYLTWFSVKKDSGKKLTVKALKDAKNIKKNTKYSVNLRITLSNGKTIEQSVNVKPVNKLPSIKVTAPKKPTLDRNDRNNILVKLNPGNGYQISKIVLVNGKDSGYFNIEMGEQDTFIINLSENIDGIKTKTYTLKYQVHFEGADNTKPVTKSIKVTVK